MTHPVNSERPTETLAAKAERLVAEARATLGPLAQVIADTIRDTPIRLGQPDTTADLIGALTVHVAAYMGRELGPGAGVLGEIVAERARQDAKFGEQNHRDGTGQYPETIDADVARMACKQAAEGGYLDWLHILREETAEAFAESDPAKLRAELVQVAAIAVAWIEAIDRRNGAQR